MDIEIIRKVRKIVKKDNENYIKTTQDFKKDFAKHRFSEDLVNNCLLKGYHCSKSELYPNPENYSSPYYSLYFTIFRSILIGYNFDLKENILILIHTSPLGNWEKQQLDRFKKKL